MWPPLTPIAFVGLTVKVAQSWVWAPVVLLTQHQVGWLGLSSSRGWKNEYRLTWNNAQFEYPWWEWWHVQDCAPIAKENPPWKAPCIWRRQRRSCSSLTPIQPWTRHIVKIGLSSSRCDMLRHSLIRTTSSWSRACGTTFTKNPTPVESYQRL